MQQNHHFSISSHLRYEAQGEGWLLLNLAVMRVPNQRVIKESLTNNRGISINEQTNRGGITRFHGLTVPTGPIEIMYEAEVERTLHADNDNTSPAEVRLVDLPPEVARFLYPSRYCESDKLVRFTAKEFGNIPPGHERVMGICNWIHENIDYVPGVTDQHTSAVDCLTLRAGVCRDFAHLGVTFCRALGIPARYGSAYAFLLPQPDFHAFFEVWLGDQWWYYDATRLAPQPGFIPIGSGHDAADTSVATMSSGVNFQSMEIYVNKLSTEYVDYANEPVSFHSKGTA